jgi:transposase
VYRLGKRMIVDILQDVFRLPMCLGSVTACEAMVSNALEVPVDEAHRYAQRAAVAHADETGWKQKNRKSWLWVMVTASLAVFKVQARRSAAMARELLGAFKGVLLSDRFGAYGFYKKRRQWCWAHLLRDFTSMSERRGKAGQIGKDLVLYTRRMFKWWHKVRDGTWTRAKFKKHMIDLRIEIMGLLIDGELCRRRGVSKLCRRLILHEEHLWTFVDREGVDPTNNAAERALRRAVIWRKVSFGTQSESGSRFVERILTTSVSCRLQGRNTLEFVTSACRAQLNQTAAPSLLPVEV